MFEVKFQQNMVQMLFAVEVMDFTFFRFRESNH